MRQSPVISPVHLLFFSFSPPLRLFVTYSETKNQRRSTYSAVCGQGKKKQNNCERPLICPLWRSFSCSPVYVCSILVLPFPPLRHVLTDQFAGRRSGGLQVCAWDHQRRASHSTSNATARRNDLQHSVLELDRLVPLPLLLQHLGWRNVLHVRCAGPTTFHERSAPRLG